MGNTNCGCCKAQNISIQQSGDIAPRTSIMNNKKQLTNKMKFDDTSQASISKRYGISNKSISKHNIQNRSIRQRREKSLSRSLSRSISQSGYSRNSSGGQIIDDFSCSQLSNQENNIEFEGTKVYAGSEIDDDTQFSINHIIKEELIEFTPIQLKEDQFQEQIQQDEAEEDLMIASLKEQAPLNFRFSPQNSTQFSTQQTPLRKRSTGSLEEEVCDSLKEETTKSEDDQKQTSFEEQEEDPEQKGFDEAVKDGESYPDIICEEIFNPGTPWKTWKKTKEYNMETRISERGFLVCHSYAQTEGTVESVADTIADYNTRGTWDINYDSGYLLKTLTDQISIHYIKTKKVAVVSSRDQYLNLSVRTVEAEDSPSGYKRSIVGARSWDFEQYPPKKGIVRASTFMTGWVLEQIEPDVVDIHFYIETDYKISLFLQKQTAPKQSNYAYFLKQFIKSQSQSKK